MTEDNSMCERIIDDLNEILQKETNIIEFSIIPTEQNDTNRSPVLHQENSLALESWCIRHVYKCAQSAALAQKTSFYNNRLTLTEITSLIKYINVTLLCVPEATTFWNMRRHLVLKDLSTPEFELNFSKLALTSKPKSLETFSFRRWILQRQLDNLTGNVVTNWMTLFKQELDLLTLVAEKLHNNYHVWTHRSWLLQIGFPLQHIEDMLEQELRFTLDWTSRHVSEHASIYYRQVLFKKCKGLPRRVGFTFMSTFNGYLNEDNPIYKDVVVKLLNRDLDETLEHSLHFAMGSKVTYFCLLLVELIFVCPSLNKMYPGHETLWYHRRFVLHSLISLIYAGYGMEIKDHAVNITYNFENDETSSSECEQQKKKSTYGLLRAKCNYFYELILQQEQQYIRDYSQDGAVCQIQKELARKHLLDRKSVV